MALLSFPADLFAQGISAGSKLSLSQEDQRELDKANQLHRKGLELQSAGREWHDEGLEWQGKDEWLDLSGDERLDEAAQVFAKEAQLRLRVQGAKHPDTLTSMNNYAFLLNKLGGAEDAEYLLVETLRLRREVLGAKHLDTLTSMNNYALCLEALGRANEAEPVLVEVLQLRREVLGAKHPDTLASMSGYATFLDSWHREKEAEPLYVEVLQLRREVLGAKHPDTLTSLGNYATMLNRLSREKEAEPLYAEAFQLRREVLGAFHLDTLGSRMGYAAVLTSLGRIKEAEEVYDQDQRKVDRASTLHVKAEQSNSLTEAAPLWAEALQLRQEVLGMEHPYTLASMSSYAMTLVALERAEEAEVLQAEALRLYKKVKGPKHPYTLTSMNNYAVALSAIGRDKESASLQAEVLQLNREVLGPKDVRTLNSLSNYAYALYLVGQTREAASLFTDALRLNKEVLGTKHSLTMIGMSYYATVLSSLGRTKEAESLFSEVIKLNREVLGAKSPETLKNLKGLASVRLELTSSSHQAIEPAREWLAAVRNFRATTGFTPSNQSQLERDEQKNNVSYQIFADAAWARGPGLTAEARAVGAQSLGKRQQALLREEAFLSLQESLTNAAGKAISATVARKAAGAMEPLVIEREALLEQWVKTDKALIKALGESNQGSYGKRVDLRMRIAELETQMRAIDNRLRKEAPDYFSLIRPETLSLAEAQKVLASDEVALMIVPMYRGTHIMVASDEGLRWVRSDWNSDKIDAAVRRLLWDVGADVAVDGAESAEWSEEGSGVYPFAFDSAYALYHELIAPIADELKGKEHVFISASGSLSSLPFGLLVSEIPEGENGDPAVLRSAKWFADDHALIQIPTLQSLEFLRKYRTSDSTAAKSSFLGIGDPVLAGKAQKRGIRRSSENSAKSDGAFKRVFQKHQTRGGTSIADISELKRMARLPGTATELAAMWEEFGKPSNALYLADQATEDFVRTGSLNAEVIAFATHGLLAGEINGAAEPGLVLTPPSEASEANDGYLSASEISALKINADWVILSACNTAAGDGGEGAPGLSGLARSFFYAGARNLLASHWPVRDDVAAELTVRTISIAKNDKKLSRAQAFQQAMREIRNDKSADRENDTWAHPSAWAPFSLIGDGAR